MSELFVPGTVKPEEDYEELARLGTKLGIPVPLMNLKVEYTPPDGETEVVYEGRSRTYVRNFWNIFAEAMAPTANSNSGAYFGDGGWAIRGVASTSDVAPSAASSTANGSYIRCGSVDAALGNSVVGIQIGTGTALESFDATSLQARVGSGTGAGQMTYAAQDAPVKSYNAGTNTWTTSVSRIFTNSSGGTIVVSEVGITAIHVHVANTSTQTNTTGVLLARDLLGTAITVLTGGQLTITYQWVIQYPSISASSPWTDVKLQIGNESGTNATSTFVDQSSFSRTVSTVNTAATWSNAFVPTGLTTTIKPSGAGALMIPHSTDFDFTGDFSIEFAFYRTASMTTSTVLFGKRADSTGFSPVFISPSSTTVLNFYISTNGTSHTSVASFTTTVSTWHYVSFGRIGRYFYLVNNATYTTPYALAEGSEVITNTSPIYLFGDSNNVNNFQTTSYLGSFRITCRGFSRGVRSPASSNTWLGGQWHSNAPGASWTLPLAQS